MESVADMDLKPQYSKKNYTRYMSIRKPTGNQSDMILTTSHNSTFKNTQTCRSVNENWNIFKGKLHETIDRCIHSRTTSSRNHLPWINSSIRSMMLRKQRLDNLARRTKKTKHWEQFIQLEHDTRRALKRAHIGHINLFRASLKKKTRFQDLLEIC